MARGETSSVLSTVTLPSCRPSPQARHDLLGKQPHRGPNQRRVHQPALVEIADELVETVFLPERANSFDAPGGVAEDADLAIHVGERHATHALRDLAERLKACRSCASGNAASVAARRKRIRPGSDWRRASSRLVAMWMGNASAVSP